MIRNVWGVRAEQLFMGKGGKPCRVQGEAVSRAEGPGVVGDARLFGDYLRAATHASGLSQLASAWCCWVICCLVARWHEVKGELLPAGVDGAGGYMEGGGSALAGLLSPGPRFGVWCLEGTRGLVFLGRVSFHFEGGHMSKDK
jgi:hypothetical protein